MPFWRAVLGYRPVGDEDLIDPTCRGPSFWFQQMDAPRPQRNRIHIDVWVPHDQAEARVAAAIAAGGHLVSDEHAPAWWILADAEGNEVDVAPGGPRLSTASSPWVPCQSLAPPSLPLDCFAGPSSRPYYLSPSPLPSFPLPPLDLLLLLPPLPFSSIAPGSVRCRARS